MSNVHKSQPINVVSLLSRGVIEVPKYQRSYSWTEREVGEFLEDLYGAVRQSESWFLGIVYTHTSQVEDGGIPKVRSLLLDGQQRLTTMFILLKELMIYHEILQDFDVADEVRTFAKESIYSLVFETATTNPRLILDEANREEFKTYLLGDSHNDAVLTFYKGGPFAKSHELLSGAITTVRSWLTERFYNPTGIQDDLTEFKKLVRFVLYDIELIEIQLTSDASFHNIFENINDRGRRLTDSDKFKNRYCSLIPRNQIDAFEEEWFKVSKSVFALGGDLDDDLFAFYYRSIGEDDLAQAGGFYSKLRKDIQSRSQPDKFRFINGVWVHIKEMLKIKEAIQTYQLSKVFHGPPGNNLSTNCKLANVLVKETWDQFSQFGVLVYALYFSFRQHNDVQSFQQFLDDIVNAARFYVSAHMSGEGANAIRPYTIEIASEMLRGRTLNEILADNDGKLDFASRLNLSKVDQLSIPNNKLSKLLIVFVQAHLGRELLEHYDPSQSWTLEHLVPIKWTENWGYLANSDFVGLTEKYSDELNRQLQLSDLDAVSKCWLLQLLGNKFVISWKQNNETRHGGLHQKQERVKEEANPVIMPSINGKGILDYKTFGADEILERTIVLRQALRDSLKKKSL